MRFRVFDNDPTRSGIPSPSSVMRGGQVPCVPAADCRIKYGVSVYDIALFGVVGHCNVLSATRYVFWVDQLDFAPEIELLMHQTKSRKRSLEIE